MPDRESLGDQGNAQQIARVVVEWDASGIRIFQNVANPFAIFMLDSAAYMKKVETIGAVKPLQQGRVVSTRAPPFSGRQVDR